MSAKFPGGGGGAGPFLARSLDVYFSLHTVRTYKARYTKIMTQKYIKLNTGEKEIQQVK